MLTTSGKIIFSGIKQLPDHWWDDPKVDVWSVWDKNTYYLWGANLSNYDLKQGQNLNGGGMAGSNGPTRGYAHDHYVGLDTMNYSDTRNPSVFQKLQTLLSEGNNIVVPIYKGKCSLGTGIGGSGDASWAKIQLQIFEGISSLIDNSDGLIVPSNTFWPDCRVQTPSKYKGDCSICSDNALAIISFGSMGTYPIGDKNDILSIIKVLS